MFYVRSFLFFRAVPVTDDTFVINVPKQSFSDSAGPGTSI